MSIRIREKLCNGCGSCQTSKCTKVCPGNLLYKDEHNKVRIRSKADCWDCAACVKECPMGAIELYLPSSGKEKNAALRAKVKSDGIIWTIINPDQTTKSYYLKNKY